jgi:N-acetylmuramoyl-L-alanine amidase
MSTMTYSHGVRRRAGRAGTTIGLLCTGLLAATACERTHATIPIRDGPLELEIRYPLDGTTGASDSTAVWGSIGAGNATLLINGARHRVERNGAFALFVPVPAGDAPVLRFEARLGETTMQKDVHLVRAAPTPPDEPPTPIAFERWVVLRRLPGDTTDSATQARPIFSRWSPGGRIALPLGQGLRLFADALWQNELRLRLTPDLRVWIAAADADTLGPDRAASLVMSGVSLTVVGSESDIALTLPEAAATQVDFMPNSLTWTLYGVSRAREAEAAPGPAGIVRRIREVDRGPERMTIEVDLAEEPLGWKVEWRGDRQVLRIRNRDAVRAGLASALIGLDAGHPPLGTTGPDGLVEDSMTLAVARAAAERLRALGGRPLLIRDDPAPMSLDARLVAADRANVDLFVSIHGNSPGAGRPPTSVDGTLVYWLQPNGFTLGRALLDEVSAALDQRPIGLLREDLAVLRATWYPAVLVEGTGLVLPYREAALRTPAGVAAYADGIVAGIVRWIDAQSTPGH